ncbi:UDP-glycosyltransferase UGT5-like [Diabrotica virgifera virgifera]|uniref:UDP-glucuronosyltransferase n=1 Tax=Diabrotica virgifera virgifera TaxID=50390 RepID=A0ABM5K6R3_DIAVI|nr:UDP-glycosyltransferase UGT5-like [Diabrotica virgifera virgifera]
MSKLTLILSLVLIFSSVDYVTPYKILGVFPFGAPSHYFLGNELIKGLASAGHDVTMITVFEEKNPPKNGSYRQVILDGVLEEQQVIFKDVTNLSKKQSAFTNPLHMLTMFNTIGYKVSEMVLSHSKMQTLMKSDEKFDIVITTQFAIEAVKALAPHFNAHLVLFNNHAANNWMNHFVGNPTLPSLNPNIVLGYPELMSFQQRLVNTLLSAATYMNYNILQYPEQNELVHKYISKDLELPAVQYNVSLVLSNSHSSLNKPAASVPCMKEIAGFHVKPPKPLPADLKKYLDAAKHGVIYFSMGSNLKSAEMTQETKDALMKAFSKRKESVLWKFEDDNLPGKPKNVRIEKWLPQSDLLAHPNIKLFITHGGFLSTIESLYHAVPTVAIPIFGDQQQNAKQSESFGYAKVLDFDTMTEESISAAIEEVISNKKYRENVQARSKMFHDRQMHPLQEAVYWIEYVVKHNGAKHLRVGYLDLAWYQYYMLDVFGLIFGTIFLIGFVIKKVLSCLYKLVKGDCDATNKSKKQKKVKKH